MKRIILFLSVVICFLSVNAQETKTEAADTTLKAKIVFETLIHDFGKINKAADGNCIFKFKNEGNIPLTLANVSASCGCTTPLWTKDPVLPGKTGEIKVRYDTNRIGAFSKSITVSSNAELVVLSIQGSVIDVTPPQPQ